MCDWKMFYEQKFLEEREEVRSKKSIFVMLCFLEQVQEVFFGLRNVLGSQLQRGFEGQIFDEYPIVSTEKFF